MTIEYERHSEANDCGTCGGLGHITDSDGLELCCPTCHGGIFIETITAIDTIDVDLEDIPTAALLEELQRREVDQ